MRNNVTPHPQTTVYVRDVASQFFFTDRLDRELGHRLYIPTGYYNLMNHEVPRREGWDLADVVCLMHK